MSSGARARIAMAGVGPHARHNHLPLIQGLGRELGAELSTVIELPSREASALERLAEHSIAADVLHCPDECAFDPRMPAPLAAELDRLLAAGRLDGLIVATDPRGHAMYLDWAATRGVDVLVDKPITAHPIEDERSARRLHQDYLAHTRAFAASGASASVMVSRRAHPGYVFLRNCATEFVESYGVPLTYVDSSFAHGYWNMPDEFFSRENHPYRHGYGALLHGGYHAVDAVCWVLGANAALDRGSDGARLEVTTRHVTPADFFAQVDEGVYKRLLGSDVSPWMRAEKAAQATSFGETDVGVLFQMMRDGRALTTGSIRVMETSLSLRSWRELPEDTYRSNGRVSRERLVIHAGHLIAIEAETRRGLGSEDDADDGSFHVRVFRNDRLVDGPRLEQHTFSSAGAGTLCDDGREGIMRAWMERRATGSSLAEHAPSVELLAAACESMTLQRQGRAPSVSIARSDAPLDAAP